MKKRIVTRFIRVSELKKFKNFIKNNYDANHTLVKK